MLSYTIYVYQYFKTVFGKFPLIYIMDWVFNYVGELQRVLPIEMYNKYEERSKEESLNLAELEDLVRYCS